MAEENEQQHEVPSQDAPGSGAKAPESGPSSKPAVPEKPATPPPPPKKPAVPAKPKGPQKEPWSGPLIDALKQAFPNQVIEAYTFLGQRQCLVSKEHLTEIMTFLRRNEVEPFDFLSDETATHWPKEEEFELVYMLYSFQTRDRVRVKTRIKEWDSIESLVAVWPGANWLEREIYDMFGIRFTNHPHLVRILLPEDWSGFPLRKDYDLRLQDVEWVRKHLGIESGQKFYVGKAAHGD